MRRERMNESQMRHLEAGRTQGEAAMTVAEIERSRNTMDAIRDIAAAMTAEEKQLDRIRTEAMQEGARLAGYPVLAGTLVSLALIVVLFFQMQGEVARRRCAHAPGCRGARGPGRPALTQFRPQAAEPFWRLLVERGWA
jgi:hypothetical protein